MFPTTSTEDGRSLVYHHGVPLLPPPRDDDDDVVTPPPAADADGDDVPPRGAVHQPPFLRVDHWPRPAVRRRPCGRRVPWTGDVQLRLEGDAATTTDGGGERVDDDEHEYEDERYALKLFSLRNPHPRKKYFSCGRH